MSQLALCILTRDVQLAAALSSRLPQEAEHLYCGTMPELREAVRRGHAHTILADFRGTAHGGHAEASLLEDVARLAPDATVVVITAAQCPEPLERQLACGQVDHVREPVELDELALLLEAHITRRLIRPVAAAPREFEAIPPVRETPSRPAARPAAVESNSSPAASKPAPSTPRFDSGSLHSGRPAPITVKEQSPAYAESDADYTVTGLTRRFETNTPKLRMMLADLEVAARHDVTVLLIGETGAGKTFLSKLIHEISPRRNEPFLPVACGALPNDLIESELFGHAKGAFTSAHADKDGKFVAARRGTILLDEIDVLGLEQQVKLLRVIESGEFEPVGSNRTIKSEARLIVASNLDLQPLVEQGKFRPDLYYRLNMLKFDVLPLRARLPDLVPLARKFVQEQSAKHNVRIDRIEDSLFTALHHYPWPGNVRELEHVIQRAVIYCRDGILSAQQLPAHVVLGMAGPSNEGKAVSSMPSSLAASPMSFDRSSSLGQQVALSEREIIEQALFKNNYSRTGTARSLGISRVTLYNKMKKYGMSK